MKLFCENMFAEHRYMIVTTFLLLINYALPTATLSSQDYNNICLLINNGELIASGNSCTDYYVCLNGVATLQSCQNGLYFSKDTQQCMPASSVNCKSAGQNPCSGAMIGTFAPAPNSCSSYYYCGSNGAIRGNCPEGENFDSVNQSCQYADQFPCAVIDNGNGNGMGDSIESGQPSEENGVNLCSYMPNGVFFGSATSCAEWNLCTNNVLSTGSCPTGFYFNPEIHKCDYPSNFKCNQVTNDPNLNDSPTTGGRCTTLGAMKPSLQCSGYYVCDGANYKLFFCHNGMYYDTESKTCVNRLNARNNCDRCQGTRDTFVNMYSDKNCAGYLYCQNGVEKSSGYCAQGSYFSELAGACVIGPQPPFGCCNPAYYETSTTEPTTTKAAETTTKAVETTTKAVDTTTKPVQTTTKAAETTTKAVETTTKAVETTTKAVETTTKPAQTTTKAVETTTKPVQTTTKAVETTKKPAQTTTKAVETTTKAVETTTKPVQTTTKAVQTTTKAVETTTKAVETTTKPVQTPTKAAEIPPLKRQWKSLQRQWRPIQKQ